MPIIGLLGLIVIIAIITIPNMATSDSDEHVGDPKRVKVDKDKLLKTLQSGTDLRYLDVPGCVLDFIDEVIQYIDNILSEKVDAPYEICESDSNIVIAFKMREQAVTWILNTYPDLGLRYFMTYHDKRDLVTQIIEQRIHERKNLKGISEVSPYDDYVTRLFKLMGPRPIIVPDSTNNPNLDLDKIQEQSRLRPEEPNGISLVKTDNISLNLDARDEFERRLMQYVPGGYDAIFHEENERRVQNEDEYRPQ